MNSDTIQSYLRNNGQIQEVTLDYKKSSPVYRRCNHLRISGDFTQVYERVILKKLIKSERKQKRK